MQQAMVDISVDCRGVATVTLNRPEKHNAFDNTLITALGKTFDELGRRSDIRVVVLAAIGKHFSAGADLSWMKQAAANDYEQNLAEARRLADMLHALYTLPQPAIARVQGSAYGGALGLISCCDMAVVADDASFAFPEARLGLIPATIAPYVIRALGERHARRYFTTGERFGADRALRMGLASEVAPLQSIDRAMTKLIEAIIDNGPEAVAAAKQLVADYSGREIDQDLIEDSSHRIARLRAAPEGREGVNAFLDKRAASWRIRR